MSWRYINPGYGELISKTDRMTCSTVYSDTANPRNGVMIRTSSKSTSWESEFYNIPLLTDKFISEIYCKFDIYTYDRYGHIGLYLGSKLNYVSISLYSLDVALNGDVVSYSIVSNKNHSVFCHFKLADSEDTGLFELTVDDSAVVSKVHSVSTAENGIRLYFDDYGDSYGIGNIILSDEAIALKESVVILPTNGVITDMTDNQDGTYTANEAGQTLLQTVDAQALISEYGGNSKITSIAPLAIPGYRANDGLSNLIGIDKISGEIVEHGTVSVPSAVTGGVVDVWNTDLTLGDLDCKQIGWKAAT